MKSLLGVLASVGMLLVFSCAAVPKKPLASGEVRLLSIDVLGAGIKGNSSFTVNIFFEAADSPDIKRACFYGSGEGPYCFDVKYATFGTKRALQVQIPGIKPGSYWGQCYAEYIRDGEIQKTNVIATQILVGP